MIKIPRLTVGQRMLQIRKAKGYSIEKTSRLSGITPPTLRCYETEKTRNPTVTIVEKFCNAMGLSVYEFFLGMEPSEKESSMDPNQVDPLSVAGLMHRTINFSFALQNELRLYVEYLDHLNACNNKKT